MLQAMQLKQQKATLVNNAALDDNISGTTLKETWCTANGGKGARKDGA
jgi:hypothetical protein